MRNLILRRERRPRTASILAPLLSCAMLTACGDPAEGLEAAVQTDTTSPLRLAAPSLDDAPGQSALAAGTPITAPLETWTWVPFPDAVCADGSPTGIGVNLTDRSDRVVIFFEGGGGCWDYATCYQLGFAANLDGYTQADFTTRKPYNNLPLLKRDDPLNPLADASFVYIPYCTGDVHSGDRVVDLGSGAQARTTHFVGHRNVAAYLNRLVPTFPDASRVWLAGWSAGGFGAAFNWDQAQTAFRDVRVDVIDDSGPPIAPQDSRWEAWLSAWNIQFPTGCTDCASGPEASLEFLTEKYGDSHRFALLSYVEDSTISFYFGLTRKRFHAELDRLAKSDLDPIENVKYFYVQGSSHTLLHSNIASPDGTRLYDWIDAMVNDDPAWSSIKP